MRATIKNRQGNLMDTIRRGGYAYQGQEGDELKFTKRLSNDFYPRWHLIAKQDNENIILNLHLDQKRPSYQGSHAHGGEYDSEIVEEELSRIKEFFK
ncbi:MAG: hypothetical protein V1684_02135 [bacterium]